MSNHEYQHWQYTVHQNIGTLIFDRAESSVNTMSVEVLDELESLLEEIASASIQALCIRSGKNSGFIAGADVSQFSQLSSQQEAQAWIDQGQRVLNRLENLSIPTIAIIQGFCLGGGCELALACRYRIAVISDNTKIGLPEVKLGIHPGWGGTIRLPRKIGIMAAMDLILSGRTVSAKTAQKMGIVDAAVPARLVENALSFFIEKKPNPCKDHVLNRLTESRLLRPLIAAFLRKKLGSKIKEAHYPAPFKVIELWERYGIYDLNAMHAEAESLGSLVLNESAQNLIHVFSLQEKLKKQGASKGLEPNIRHVHVVGAGVMGGDIAIWCALRGLRVTLEDLSLPLMGAAIQRAYQLAQKRYPKEPHRVMAMMDRLMPDPTGLGVAHADVIIEAVTEKVEVKRALFERLEKTARAEAILATNTSTIPLEQIATVLHHPHRLIGIHFFNPVEKMPLVEIVMTPKTDPHIIERGVAFVKSLDKLPVVVKSAPGFLVNRILIPYMLEALVLLEEGIPATVIDKIACDFGMPMGPIALADKVGLDVCLAAITGLAPRAGTALAVERLKNLIAQKKLGLKTGEGFYRYHQGKICAERQNVALNLEGMPSDLTDRLVGRLLNEAMACVREGIVADADLVDAGCIFGFGFPPFLGGLLYWANRVGTESIVHKLQGLQERYGADFSCDRGWLV